MITHKHMFIQINIVIPDFNSDIAKNAAGK